MESWQPSRIYYDQLDRFLESWLSAAIDSKFYTLFATLFGLGFAIQLTRAESRGMSIVPLYCRRLFVLLLIGLTHATLLRNGDILVPYAVTGFVLLAFRNAPNWTLAVGASIGLALPYLTRAVWMMAGLPFPQRPETANISYLTDNFAWLRYWYSTAVFTWPAVLPMFLFGLYMGKKRNLEKLVSNRTKLLQVLVTGLVIGVVAYWWRQFLFQKWINSGMHPGRRVFLGILYSLHAWGLAAAYATFLMLLWRKPPWKTCLMPLASIGRMALTNYLLQAILIVPICLALNLFDRVTPTLGLLLAFVVFAIQVLFSLLWLKKFRYGPAEWVWRSLTYGHPQDMRS